MPEHLLEARTDIVTAGRSHHHGAKRPIAIDARQCGSDAITLSTARPSLSVIVATSLSSTMKGGRQQDVVALAAVDGAAHRVAHQALVPWPPS